MKGEEKGRKGKRSNGKIFCLHVIIAKLFSPDTYVKFLKHCHIIQKQKQDSLPFMVSKGEWVDLIFSPFNRKLHFVSSWIFHNFPLQAYRVPSKLVNDVPSASKWIRKLCPFSSVSQQRDCRRCLCWEKRAVGGQSPRSLADAAVPVDMRSWAEPKWILIPTHVLRQASQHTDALAWVWMDVYSLQRMLYTQRWKYCQMTVFDCGKEGLESLFWEWYKRKEAEKPGGGWQGSNCPEGKEEKPGWSGDVWGRQNLKLPGSCQAEPSHRS